MGGGCVFEQSLFLVIFGVRCKCSMAFFFQISFQFTTPRTQTIAPSPAAAAPVRTMLGMAQLAYGAVHTIKATLPFDITNGLISRKLTSLEAVVNGIDAMFIHVKKRGCSFAYDVRAALAKRYMDECYRLNKAKSRDVVIHNGCCAANDCEYTTHAQLFCVFLTYRDDDAKDEKKKERVAALEDAQAVERRKAREALKKKKLDDLEEKLKNAAPHVREHFEKRKQQLDEIERQKHSQDKNTKRKRDNQEEDIDVTATNGDRRPKKQLRITSD